MTDHAFDSDSDSDETENAWVYFNDEHDGDAYASWIELLANEKNRRGLCRISIEYFARRGGYKEIAEIGCVDDKGKSPSSSQFAAIDPNRTARDAFELATKDHKRNARTHYRMQLWHNTPKRNDEEKRGEYATIRFDKDGADDSSSAASPEATVWKEVRGMLQDARKFALEMANAQIQMAQAASGTSLYGLQMVEEMARKKSELADVAAAIRMQPSAQDVNARIESVMSRLEQPLAVLAQSVAPKVQQWASGMNGAAGAQPPPQDGSAPPPSSGNPDGQARAQAFFEGLTADQKDSLRDAMGAEKFGALVEVIVGPADQWAREAQNIKPTLLPHLVELRKILTPEQFAALMEV